MLLEMTDIYLLKKDKYKPYVSNASPVKIYIEKIIFYSIFSHINTVLTIF